MEHKNFPIKKIAFTNIGVTHSWEAIKKLWKLSQQIINFHPILTKLSTTFPFNNIISTLFLLLLQEHKKQ